MEVSPSKRRKTSPLTSVPVSPQNAPERPTSQHGERTPSQRASFMSPTKASLARFNPSLLPGLTSTEPRRPVTRGNQGLPRRTLDSGGSEHGTRGATSEILALGPTQTVSGRNGVVGARAPETPRNVLSAAPKRRSQTPATEYTPSRQPRIRAVDDPRASPPEVEAGVGPLRLVGDRNGIELPVSVAASTHLTEHDGLLNGRTIVTDKPQVPLTLHQFKNARLGAHVETEEDGEPSLPSTPTQLGLEAPPERPRGLLFSSPSRRPKRRDNSKAKPSPLKPRGALPKPPVARQGPAIAALGPKIFLPNLPKPPPTSEESEIQRKTADLTETENLLKELEVDVLGRLLMSKWQKEDAKQKRELLKRRKFVREKADRFLRLRDETSQLQPALSVALGESAVPQPERDVEGAAHTGQTYSAFRELPTIRPSVSQRVSHFLPFSGRPHPPLPKLSLIDDSGATPSIETEETTTGPAPFSIKISNVALLPKASDSDALQQQDVDFITSQHSIPLTLQLTTNITTQRFIRISAVHLPSWAVAEFGLWLQEAPDELDVEAVGTAVGRFWRLSQLRARCWHQCQIEFPDLTVNAVSPNGRSSVEPPEQEHLGCQFQQFSRSSVSITVHWRLSFTLEGEAESHVYAGATFPTAWKQADRSDELGKVGQAFDLLVRDRGVTDAVRMILRLIFPS